MYNVYSKDITLRDYNWFYDNQIQTLLYFQYSIRIQSVTRPTIVTINNNNEVKIKISPHRRSPVRGNKSVCSKNY